MTRHKMNDVYAVKLKLPLKPTTEKLITKENLTSMSVVLIVRPKCTLAASHVALW